MNRQRQGHRSLILSLLGWVAASFAFGFLVMPPLYDLFCDITGFGGRTNASAAVVSEAPDLDRTVRIEFITQTNEYAPWAFSADAPSMEVHPGKLYYATFTATNLTGDDKVAQAIPSVAPIAASEHFRKLECFCFESQAFLAGEKRELPLSFIVDPDLPDYVDTITLQYTMFDTVRLSAINPE